MVVVSSYPGPGDILYLDLDHISSITYASDTKFTEQKQDKKAE